MLGWDWVLGGGDWVQIYYLRREVEVSRKVSSEAIFVHQEDQTLL